MSGGTERCLQLATPVAIVEDPHLQEVLLVTGGSAARACSQTKRSQSFHSVVVVTVRPRMSARGEQESQGTPLVV